MLRTPAGPRPVAPRKRPQAYVFDLDGTLADVNGRDPYNASRCDEDPPNEAVLTLARVLQASGFGIVCVSGRQERVRPQTHAFLVWHGIEYLQLFMRADGDPRPDPVVKREMYDCHIRERFDVLAVFDDRPVVCAMWRSLGLAVFRVVGDEEDRS